MKQFAPISRSTDRDISFLVRRTNREINPVNILSRFAIDNLWYLRISATWSSPTTVSRCHPLVFPLLSISLVLQAECEFILLFPYYSRKLSYLFTYGLFGVRPRVRSPCVYADIISFSASPAVLGHDADIGGGLSHRTTMGA